MDAVFSVKEENNHPPIESFREQRQPETFFQMEFIQPVLDQIDIGKCDKRNNVRNRQFSSIVKVENCQSLTKDSIIEPNLQRLQPGSFKRHQNVLNRQFSPTPKEEHAKDMEEQSFEQRCLLPEIKRYEHVHDSWSMKREMKEETSQHSFEPSVVSTWDDDVDVEVLIKRKKHLLGVKLENVLVIEEGYEPAVADNNMYREQLPKHHQSLSDIIDIMNEECRCSHLPMFHLCFELLQLFLVRRYEVATRGFLVPDECNVSYDPSDYDCAVVEARKNSTVSSNSGCFVVHRIDRSERLLKFASAAVNHFYKVQTDLGDFKIKAEDLLLEMLAKIQLGNRDDVEPRFPLQVDISGLPILIPGPSEGLSPKESKDASSLCYIFSANYPNDEGVLCGIQNLDTADDKLPDFSLTELKLRLRGKGSSKEPHIRKGDRDALLLIPNITLNHSWTIDCWVKFPLRGVGRDFVLCSGASILEGSHIIFRRLPGGGLVVGCLGDSRNRIVHASDKIEDRSPYRNRNNGNIEFNPATRRNEEGNRYIKNLISLIGWQRLTVVCDLTRQVFYLDGWNIGSTDVSITCPIECLGNARPYGNALGGAFARFKIYQGKLSPKEVCCLIGKEHVEENSLFITADNVTWIKRDNK